MTTQPANRIYPQQTIPWNEFPAQQEKKLGKNPQVQFVLKKEVYPISEMKTLDLCDVGSEKDLRFNEIYPIEFPVISVLDAIAGDEQLGRHFRLPAERSSSPQRT